MKIIYDTRNRENSKVIFECKEERDAVFEESCPSHFGLLEGECTDDSNEECCAECWNAAVKCEIAEPKAMVVLESVLDSCNDCITKNGMMIRKMFELLKRAINAKQAFYWKKFLLATSEICRKHQQLVTENVGTEHEYQHYSCQKCPYNVKNFGKTKLTGCILSTPDGWDESKQARYIVRTTIQYMAKGGADYGKR